MNVTPLILAILLTPAANWAAEQEVKSVTAKAKELMSREFSYTPTEKIAAHEVDENVANDSVIKLPTFTVTDARLRRDVEHAVNKARHDLEAKKFNWKNGGTIKEFKRGNRTIEIGMWPNGFSSFTLLQIKW